MSPKSDPARAILICDSGRLNQLFALFDGEAVRIERVLTNILRPADFAHAGGLTPCLPACDVDRLAADEADLRIVVRDQHDKGLLDRLALRGFERRRVLDLDVQELFRNASGLRSAARAVQQSALRWRGFLTGLSYFRGGVIESAFDDQLANFAGDSQDLYYDFALARDVLLASPQRFQYAVIGLAPYSFDYDMALGGEPWRFIKYYPTLRDDHGVAAALPAPLGGLFSRRLYDIASAEAETLTQASFPRLFYTHRPERLNLDSVLEGRQKAVSWNGRRFPVTQAANSEILSRYVDLCRSAGLAVFIATPPMSSLFRDAYGAERLAEFHAKLRPELEKPGVRFRDFYSETEYDLHHMYDADHLNTKGALRFSAELRAWIEQTLAGGCL
ncbi:hypothetical protein LJR225_004100 [Phenylobacterium sp. LjRoot225]|uniref:hypothetical protein n=1 Tax=Phenylobacterium sp. LjRoot225 TaxID=3342285 RepID=UPI003ED0598B